MDIVAQVVIPFPRTAVFEVYRDHMLDLVKFLPNIRRIDLTSRTVETAYTDVVTVWHGGGDIPAVARAFLTEAMLSWTDIARWKSDDLSCEWRVESHSFREAVHSSGRNEYQRFSHGDEEHTRVEIRGSITIDPEKIRGVPGFLARKIAPTAEGIISKQVGPNLAAVGAGVTRYLQDLRENSRS